MTASTPPRIDVGLTQLDHGSPALPPAGTRPDAIAPATAPMQYGTSTDDDANAAPKFALARACANTALRNAKLEPRSTMPSAASVSGTNSVSVIDANASENAGPQHDEAEDQPDVVRFPHRADRVVDDARAAAAPRSAPPAIEVPEPGAEVGAAEQRVRGDAEEQDDGDDVGSSRHRHRRLRVRGRAPTARAGRTARRVSSRVALGVAPAPAHAAQHQDQS